MFQFIKLVKITFYAVDAVTDISETSNISADDMSDH